MDKNNHSAGSTHNAHQSLEQLIEISNQQTEQIKKLLDITTELRIKDDVNHLVFLALFNKLLVKNDKKIIYQILYESLDHAIENDEFNLRARHINYLNQLFANNETEIS